MNSEIVVRTTRAGPVPTLPLVVVRECLGDSLPVNAGEGVPGAFLAQSITINRLGGHNIDRKINIMCVCISGEGK